MEGLRTGAAIGLGPPVRLAGALTWLVAIVMTLTSAYALVEWELVYVRADAPLVPLLVGQDALNLIVALPLLLGAMWLSGRGSAVGAVLWLGALFYVAYDYGYYVLGVPYNALFIPYIALVSASLWAFVAVLTSIDRTLVRARFEARVPTNIVGGFLCVLAALFTVLWTALNVSSFSSGIEVDPILRVVTIMDLGLQLPALFVGGVLLWRGTALGYVVAPALLVQAAAYLAGLSAITLLTEVLTGGFDAAAVIPGFAVGVIGVALFALFVRADARA